MAQRFFTISYTPALLIKQVLILIVCSITHYKTIKMDRSRSTVSLFNELNYFMIEKDYLNGVRHKQSVDYSRKCAYFYERISTQIQEYYHIIYQLPQKLKDALEITLPHPNPQFEKFKSFLKKFFQIFTLLSHFQINELTKCRSSLSQNRQSSFQNFIEAIERYRVLQEEFEQDRTNYKTLCLGIENRFKDFMKLLNKIEQNFNGKLIKDELSRCKQQLAKKQRLEQDINAKSEEMAANSRFFQKQLMFHRQKLVSFKYSYIEKISRFCANAKQSLMEIITFMNELVIQSKQAFTINKNIKTDQDIGNIRDLGEQIKTSTKKYQETTDKYLAIIRALINIFTEVSTEIKQQKGRQMEIIEQMNKYFQYNECNITEVLNTMDAYTVFLKYLSQLGDKLIYSENNMRILQKNVNKQKQITLTIFKRKSSSERLLSSSSLNKMSINPKQRQNEKDYIYSLFEQMNPIYINGIILKIFHDFEETVVKISDTFLMNRPTKKFTENSMSMSHIQAGYVDSERRPFKCDIWLWREWRRQICKDFIDVLQVKTVIGQMDKFIEKYNADDKQIQKLSCVFVEKKLKGILKLKTQSLTFQSINNSHQYFIPFSKIESIDMQLNMMSKAVMIETVHGNLVFADENAKDIKKFYVSVQKALDFYNQNNDEGKVTKEVVLMSEEELDFIKKRRIKIESDLEKESDYELFNTVMLENVTINDTYRVIYSDNKITLKGKEYPCFIDTLMKKFNNHNQKYTPFEPQGPEFYSGFNGINFQNCPLFSERIIQFDHTLPKIPFLPEACHNTQTVRVYWVSHQQFHLKQTNVTSGAPYTQNFLITMLYKVSKVAEDVQIRFFIRVNIVHDFSLKKMVVGKATEEAKLGSSILIEEMKKCMLGYKRKQGKEGTRPQNLEQSNFSDKTIVKSYKTKIKDLEGKNKILMYILGAVLIINILIQLFF